MTHLRINKSKYSKPDPPRRTLRRLFACSVLKANIAFNAIAKTLNKNTAFHLIHEHPHIFNGITKASWRVAVEQHRLRGQAISTHQGKVPWSNSPHNAQGHYELIHTEHICPRLVRGRPSPAAVWQIVCDWILRRPVSISVKPAISLKTNWYASMRGSLFRSPARKQDVPSLCDELFVMLATWLAMIFAASIEKYSLDRPNMYSWLPSASYSDNAGTYQLLESELKQHPNF